MRLVKVRDCSSKMLGEETELAYCVAAEWQGSGHLPKAVCSLCSIIQYSGREAVIKMMKCKTEQPHHLSALHSFNIFKEILGRIGRVNAFCHIAQVLTPFGQGLPSFCVRFQVCKNKLHSLRMVVASSDLSVEGSLNERRWTSGS